MGTQLSKSFPQLFHIIIQPQAIYINRSVANNFHSLTNSKAVLLNLKETALMLKKRKRKEETCVAQVRRLGFNDVVKNVDA